MNTKHIISGFTATLLGIVISSCAEDKYYDMEGAEGGLVAFKAVNLALGDIDQAESTSEDYYYLLENIDKIFPITLYYPTNITDGVMESSKKEISIEKTHTVWVAGYNDIEITFIPTAPEETSATFIMPDGSTHTATRENPSFIWTPDISLRDNSFVPNSHFCIYAENQYKKGNTTYINTGYIYLDIDDRCRYDKATEKWYYSSWFYGETLTLPSYSKFTVDVEAIWRSDICTSSNRMFPETIISRTDRISLPLLVGNDENPIDFTSDLQSNEFLACKYSTVIFTFIPENGEEYMTLQLPNGSTAHLTPSNPTYAWYLDDKVQSNYNDYTIHGFTSYTKDGIIYNAESDVIMIYDTDFWFNSSRAAFVRY